jgi:hypothetical protein
MTATFYVGDAIETMNALPENSVSMVIPSTMTGCLNLPLSLAVGWKSSPSQKMDVGFGVLRWTTTGTGNSSTPLTAVKCMSERIDGPSSTSLAQSETAKLSCTYATPRGVSIPTTSTPEHRSRTTTTRLLGADRRGCGATPSTGPAKITASTAIPYGVAICGSIQRRDIGVAASVPLIERGSPTTDSVEGGW